MLRTVRFQVHGNDTIGDNMTYLFVVVISVSVGFVLGAAWAGLGAKNKQMDNTVSATIRNHYPDIKN